MRRLLLALLLLVLLPAPALPAPPALTVMTRNVYVGFDVDAVLAALDSTDPNALVLAATQAFIAVRATDFEERARELASEIARRKPDVVGLQEISLFQIQDPSDFLLDPRPNATEIVFDYLELLLEALQARGLAYEVAAIQQNIDVEVPALRDNLVCCVDIRLTDFDVLLVRSGLTVASSLGERFATLLEVPCGPCGGVFVSPRSWVGADVIVGGQTVRVVSTHLEPAGDGTVQVAQAAELLAGPLDTALPFVLIGDLNSPADGSGTGTYALLTGAALTDAWAAAHPRRPGFTCCHDPSLRNRKPSLDQRLDLVLVSEGFKIVNATVLGDQRGDRTPSGLWPSDHAGVAVKLRLQ